MTKIFENDDYKILKYNTLNFKIIIKPKWQLKYHNSGLGRIYYSNMDLGIDNAKKIAESMIEQHYKL